ncbi:unnamed protein product [Medioppia subpectinata]|uniref:Uncharacterized protein n=1 Tax=Medioppia subpectinata TaxID=1979941 RepID=A0A7R9KYH7_9ACAR|nr:unnamed protein product [Medioppia subpectinata]CAG2112187.1 unnamed protein product [Medioppia subpectinata]
MLESPTIQFYEKVNLFCKLPDDKMLKYTPIINAKLVETKKLRDRFLGYLNDATKQSRINMGEIVCFWDIITGLKWAGYLKPKVREVMLESPTIQFYEKVNLFCKLPEDKMLKYTPIINAKLADTKKLRDRYLGYLNDALNQTRINMGEIVCVGRDFWAKVIDMHDDLDGFREFSHRRVDLYPAVLNRTEHVLGVKVDTKCEMKESYPEATYKSFTVLIAKLLTKYLESAL